MEPQQIQVQSADPSLNNNNNNAGDDDEELDVEFGIPGESKVVVSKPPGGKNKYSKSETESFEGKTEKQMAEEAKQICKGEVFCFSGCADSQESADVADVEQSFGLKAPDEASKGGGAMTNSLLSVVRADPNVSFGDLLVRMRDTLKSKKYTQNPQLSCSHQINLKESKFSIVAPNSNGNKKALLIGTNYTGTDAELNGCVNDVRQMEKFLREQGWPVDNPEKTRILTDEKGYGQALPTGKNILEAFKWLMKDAQSGDSFFVHVSGHGVSVYDVEQKEEDGRDEAYAPVDFDDNGFIRDDVFFSALVAPLPEGARLVATIDTCHSGSMLDLPHVAVFDEMTAKEYVNGALTKLKANAMFSFNYAKNLSQKVWKGMFDFGSGAVDDMKDTVQRWRARWKNRRKDGGTCCFCF